jgi:hypothetical protein
MVRLTHASKRSPIRMRDHAAATALRHFACRRGSEDTQRRSRDEMALKVEIVVDGSVLTGKALGGSSRFEPLHYALSSSHRLIRVFCTIVRLEPLFVGTCQPQTPQRQGVGTQFVGHQQLRRKPLLLEQL